MNNVRKKPEQFLQAIQRDEASKQRGHLKIFFGYAAGVGKTYTMLQAAHVAQKRGIDVAVGYVEPHDRPKTMELLEGLEQLPTLDIDYNGITLHEFDLDGAIKRRPQLLLVDELAHTNAEGCRHSKRYQDIEELLSQGIDVYTAVNVQHIESLNDMVASVTQVLVRERIPDEIFDNADQVELVDIEPAELLERFKEGDVYKKVQAERARENFFSVQNLTALREIALRRCADRVNLLAEQAHYGNKNEFLTDEHILVGLSASPSNPKIIRTAARMAKAFHGSFTALFVKTPDFAAMEDADIKRLQDNMHLARQLGAKIEELSGDDVPLHIAEFARVSGVSKIVIGRSAATRRGLFPAPTFAERLTANSPQLDVYIIPDTVNLQAINSYRAKKAKKPYGFNFSWEDVLKSILVLGLTSLLGLLFLALGFAEANIISIYLLGVLVISVITQDQIYSLISSVFSVLIFNFLFTYPRFSLRAYDHGYPVTFLIMFIVAFVSSRLAARLKQHATASAQQAYRNKVLFETNQLLQQAKERQSIVSVAAKQLSKLLQRSIVFYLAKENEKSLSLDKPYLCGVNDSVVPSIYLMPNEQTVADWVLRNNRHAGATTDTLSSAKCFYLAVRTNNRVYGVIGIVIEDKPLDAFENSILLSVLGECALALENELNAREKEQAAVLAKNEQLRANLLRSISHDLRTPLTSISGNASNLLSNGSYFDEETKKQIYGDIYDDSMWLINLVENLLSVTRLEDGKLNLHLEEELLDDVVEEALLHVNRQRINHHIDVINDEPYLLAKVDARLMVQVIINIVDNAIKYTPKDSHITIKLAKKGKNAVITIADDGPGISGDIKGHVFDMFYTDAHKIADSRRSLGLGLALCRSIVHAHGGWLTLEDNVPRGAIFTITLPTGEVQLHE